MRSSFSQYSISLSHPHSRILGGKYTVLVSHTHTCCVRWVECWEHCHCLPPAADILIHNAAGIRAYTKMEITHTNDLFINNTTPVNERSQWLEARQLKTCVWKECLPCQGSAVIYYVTWTNPIQLAFTSCTSPSEHSFSAWLILVWISAGTVALLLWGGAVVAVIRYTAVLPGSVPF